MAERDREKLAVASIFAGIGGFEVGLNGSFRVELQCENDAAARAVLEDRFDATNLGDVRDLRPSHMDGIDLLTAGFPCQDLSPAGLTAGIRGEDSGLIGEVFRVLDERPVPWVLLENVPFMLQLHEGKAIEYVVSRLERIGYRWAYRVIDARAFGLPQRRKRVFILAALEAEPEKSLLSSEAYPDLPTDHRGRPCGFYWTEGNRGLGWAVDSIPTLKGGSGVSIPSPPAVWLPGGDIVTPSLEAAEALQGFEPGWTSAAEEVVPRRARWKLVGNAVSPRVSEWIAERILPGPVDSPLAAIPSPLQPGARWPSAAFGSREGRFSIDVSHFPEARPLEPLADFLKHGTSALSHRATSGFHSRLEKSRLDRPEEFDRALVAHIERVAS